jgi:hypothetical protein
MARFTLILLGLSLFIALFFVVLPHPSRGPAAPEPHTKPTVVAESRVGPAYIYPRTDLTPGKIDPSVTQENIETTICRAGYTETVRPSRSVAYHLKVRVMAAYGRNDPPSEYELDHFIPLELGGCPDCVSNLWPEPRHPFGAKEKDIVENYLRRRVCAGDMTLRDAQDAITRDWAWVYEHDSSSSKRQRPHRTQLAANTP